MTESLLFFCGQRPISLLPYSSFCLGGPTVCMQLLLFPCVALLHRREGDTFPDSTFRSLGNSRECEEGQAGCVLFPGVTPCTLSTLPCKHLTPDATGSLWLFMPIACPKYTFCIHRRYQDIGTSQGIYIPPPLRGQLYWNYEDFPREDRVEISLSFTPWARLRIKQSSAWMAVLASSSEANSSTVSHTPAPLTTNPILSPSPRKWGTRQRPLKGGWDLKTGVCWYSIPVCFRREPRRPQRSLGSQNEEPLFYSGQSQQSEISLCHYQKLCTANGITYGQENVSSFSYSV